MVAESDVVMAYRLFMGREPENQDVVRGIAGAHANLMQLRQTFLTSPEFIEKFGRAPAVDGLSGHKPLNWPATKIEVDVAPDVIDRMLTRVEGEFVDLGEIEPHWSVLTEDRFKAAVITETEPEFFKTGQWVVNDLSLAAERSGIDLSGYRTCFELGCGLGRSTIWLALKFAQVHAADISALHLRMARENARKFGRDNIEFFHLNALSRYDDIPAFDIFFSIIVLQHNPPPVMRLILEKLLGKINPGGLGYFQIPTYALKYEFNVEAYLATPAPAHEVEVHCLPQPVLHEIIDKAGCELIEMREDGAVGASSISNRLLVRKRAGG